MIVIPAVDLRDGACVQLVGGSYDDERIRLDDPPGIARRWEYEGFKHLHVVDLDAATGRGSNRNIVYDVLRATSLEVQVGGGIREMSDIEALLNEGAQRVVVGTRGIEDPDWLDEVSQEFPQTIIVAADVRDRRIVTRGWGQLSSRNVMDVVEELNAFPLAGIMVTAVHKEGQMLGTDLPLMEDVAEESTFPVYASGGIASMNDLSALADRGIAGAIIGMALYTGALNTQAVIQEFGDDE